MYWHLCYLPHFSLLSTINAAHNSIINDQCCSQSYYQQSILLIILLSTINAAHNPIINNQSCSQSYYQ